MKPERACLSSENGGQRSSELLGSVRLSNACFLRLEMRYRLKLGLSSGSPFRFGASGKKFSRFKRSTKTRYSRTVHCLQKITLISR